MKIIICTTPIRPAPTCYPPFGSLAVIQSLRQAGYAPTFLDIDGCRPSFEEVVEHFRREQPDVVGISAVVSTAYGFVKKLAPAIRAVSPKTRIVLGGNLAASAELVHRRCAIDLCAVGEGERVIVNIVKYLEANPTTPDFQALSKIKGITYVDEAGDVAFTGYEVALRPDEFLDPDFSILDEYSVIRNFVKDPNDREEFRDDPRSRQPHLVGKLMSTVVSTKGCVARCTFCHRWDKGYRQIAPAAIVGRIKYLMEQYNVGFIQFGDENFGSDRRATDELLRLLKPLNILWQVAGVRARTLDRDLLERMRDAGCTAVYCGFETGSPDLLSVMEKNLQLEDNLKAARDIFETGHRTVYQLILGMPEETPSTIRETLEMAKQVTEFLPRPPIEFLSVNYIQALPGTPVYEYARTTGGIGPGLDGEEEYLMSISDVEAADDTKFINFTPYPYLVVRTWKRFIQWEATVHWYRHQRARDLSRSKVSDYMQGGYFNLQKARMSPALLNSLYPLRWPIIWARTLTTEFMASPRLFAKRVAEVALWPLRRKATQRDTRSLRKLMTERTPEPATASERNLMPLRLGR